MLHEKLHDSGNKTLSCWTVAQVKLQKINALKGARTGSRCHKRKLSLAPCCSVAPMGSVCASAKHGVGRIIGQQIQPSMVLHLSRKNWKLCCVSQFMTHVRWKCICRLFPVPNDVLGQNWHSRRNFCNVHTCVVDLWCSVFVVIKQRKHHKTFTMDDYACAT